MENTSLREVMERLEWEVTRSENRTRKLSVQFQTLCTETEVLKIDVSNQALQDQAKSLSCSEGFRAIVRDGKKRKATLTATAVGAFACAVFGRDGFSALGSGLSVFDRALKGLANSNWAVSLDMDLRIVPQNKITPGYKLVTLSDLLGLRALKEKAQSAEGFKDLSSIIAALRSETKLLRLLQVSSGQVAVCREESTDKT